MHMYVCICIYTYICMYICICTYHGNMVTMIKLVNTSITSPVCLCMYVYMCVCVCVVRTFKIYFLSKFQG